MEYYYVNYDYLSEDEIKKLSKKTGLEIQAKPESLPVMRLNTHTSAIVMMNVHCGGRILLL